MQKLLMIVFLTSVPASAAEDSNMAVASKGKLMRRNRVDQQIRQHAYTDAQQKAQQKATKAGRSASELTFPAGITTGQLRLSGSLSSINNCLVTHGTSTHAKLGMGNCNNAMSRWTVGASTLRGKKAYSAGLVALQVHANQDCKAEGKHGKADCKCKNAGCCLDSRVQDHRQEVCDASKESNNCQTAVVFPCNGHLNQAWGYNSTSMQVMQQKHVGGALVQQCLEATTKWTRSGKYTVSSQPCKSSTLQQWTLTEARAK